MGVSGFLPAASRRAVIGFGVAVLVSVASGVSAQQASAQTDTATATASADVPAPAPAPAPATVDPLKFNLDVPLLLVNFVKRDKAADFEAVWKEIRSGLAASAKPELQEFGKTLEKWYKVEPEKGPPTSFIYIFQIETPSKTQTYNHVRILNESGVWDRAKADELFAKLKDCYESINPWPLFKVG